MMIMHAIREADTAFEVYQLLNAYVEAVRLDRETCHLSPSSASAPIAGVDELMQQIKALVEALGTASRRLDDHSRTLIKEVLYVFCMAADQLGSLHRLAYQPIVTIRAEAMRPVATSSVVPICPEGRGNRSSDVHYTTGMAKVQREGAARFLTF